MGEVGCVDGFGGEMGGEDGLDFRQAVEPGEEVLGQLAILEAQVELLTDGQRERAILPLRVMAVFESVALFACGAMITGMRQGQNPTEGF